MRLFNVMFGILILAALFSCGGPKPTVEMVKVEGGSFVMGTKEGPIAQRPEHEVALRTYLMSKYEVTQGLWERIMKENPARYQGKRLKPNTDNTKLPVEMINWYEAITFCNKLSKEEGFEPVYIINEKESDPNNKHSLDRYKWTITVNWNANGYRLPTEAEWEYAAKGGKYSKGYKYAGGNDEDLREISCCDYNSDAYTFEVGSKKPNELGIHDMTGNVFEWCWDKFNKTYYQNSPVENPVGPEKGQYKNRVIRGGGWGTIMDGEVTFRSRSVKVSPGSRYDWIGMRLVRIYDADLETRIAQK